MEEYVGIVCAVCEAFSPLGAPRCVNCGNELTAVREPADDQPTSAEALAEAPAIGEAALSEEELMEQARNYVCKECSCPVPSGHKFCGGCGAGVPQAVQDAQTKYFGAMQAPGKARLILIRGDQDVDGLSYLLQGKEHIAGRRDAQILFPQDGWLSPRHANFIYRDEKLVVVDEGSRNGVFVRVKGSVPIAMGTEFLCGEQVFRVDPTPKDTSGPNPDQTYFYSSPKRPNVFRIVQLIAGGSAGMVHCARENTAQVGREDCDMNFPEDIYMSGTHASVGLQGDQLTLTDLDSRNGTYVRIQGEQELAHGDYLFLGKQLLRVEMTA